MFGIIIAVINLHKIFAGLLRKKRLGFFFRWMYLVNFTE